MMSNMFIYSSKLIVDCSHFNVDNVTTHTDFNTSAPGVIAPVRKF